MWQAATFDPATIDRELGWAAALGMNAVRVYLHDLLWEQDAAGLRGRIDRFLAIAAGHGMRVMLVFFDDCYNPDPRSGPQPEPVPGVHGSGWVQSPGPAAKADPAQWGRLERYVKGVIAAFADDSRVLAWDLYNEPGNSGQGNASLPLLRAVFGWARAVRPSQPLTAPLWWDLPEINRFLLAACDLISFHDYQNEEHLAATVRRLRRHGYPLLCTEWLRRPLSNVATHLPLFRQGRIGCFNWGLVSGKTQTIYGWGSPPGAPEPALWFHDLLRRDGTPFDAAEASCFRRLTGRGATS